MVEWIDWGGHWSNIIGYDTMGTFYMWLDKKILPKEQGVQQWLIAKPKK